MSKYFAVLNPLNGQHTKCNTEDERNDVIAAIAFELYQHNVGSNLYSTVEILEDGSEKWSAPSGVDLIPPEVLKALIKRQVAPAATMGVTTL
jgi:hypothetical protein